MKILNFAVIMAGFLSWLISCNEPKNGIEFQDNKFKVGQIWKYKTRKGEENSSLTILKIEKYNSEGVVIHIYVDKLKVKNPQQKSGFSKEIGHLPLSKGALLKSVTALVSENNKLPDFGEGYNIWKEAFDSNTGGVFSVVVSDAVEYVEETMNTGQRTDN